MSETVDALLQPLEPRLRAGLAWFLDRRDTEIVWPPLLDDGTRLASKAKAIYKPEWTEYALSVRQNLNSPYPDRDPVLHADGSWTYDYYQENLDETQRDGPFTNAALLANKLDRVPVAVWRQISPKPNSKYRILGLGLVTGWQGGYFTIRGFPPSGELVSADKADEVEKTLTAQAETMAADDFDPAGSDGLRERELRSIARRRGQPGFRKKLLKAYGAACAISGCKDAGVLDAAHIAPHRGIESNHIQNGLLLRTDLHTLFDVGLLSIDPADMKVRVAPSVVSTEYRALDGRALRLPRDAAQRPSKKALAKHWTEASADWTPQ